MIIQMALLIGLRPHRNSKMENQKKTWKSLRRILLTIMGKNYLSLSKLKSNKYQLNISEIHLIR